MCLGVCWTDLKLEKMAGRYLLSHLQYYHRLISVSLLCSEWEQVGPLRYCHPVTGLALVEMLPYLDHQIYNSTKSNDVISQGILHLSERLANLNHDLFIIFIVSLPFRAETSLANSKIHNNKPS